MPQVQETILGFNPSEVAAARAKAESQGNNWDELGPVNQGRYIRSVSGRRLTDYQDDPKYAQYTLPGGENYREVLLTTPVVGEKGDALNKIAQNMFGKNYTDLMGDNSDNAKMRLAVKREYQNQYGESGLKAEDAAMFRSKHWDDPNILAHLRMADRTGPNGEKILHVEELQSDWGQKGRDNGFKSNDVNINDLQNQYRKLDQKRKETYDQLINEGSASVTSVYDHPDFKQITDKLSGLDQQIKKANNAVPSAPYVTNTGSWTDLALKRALKEAAEGGYDKLVWTPGSEQAQRYDLSKQISRLVLENNPAGGHKLRAYSPSGDQVINQRIVDADKELPDLVGKEVAQKLLNQDLVNPKVFNENLTKDDISVVPKENRYQISAPWGWSTHVGMGVVNSPEAAAEYGANHFSNLAREANSQMGTGHATEYKNATRTLVGQDLSVGGEGMKSYYDSIVPKQLQKITKQYDPSAKVGYTDVMLPPSGKAGTNNPPIAAPGIDITPQMRDTIMRGQKAFKQGGVIMGNNEHISHALRIAQSLGRGDDTILAHINPREAALLKKRGGSGKINPRTGLIEFDEGDSKDSETKDSSSSDSSSSDNVRADSVSQSEQASADAAVKAQADEAARAYAANEADNAAADAAVAAASQTSSDTTGGTTDTAPKPDTTGGDTGGKSWYDKVLESAGNAFVSPAEAAAPTVQVGDPTTVVKPNTEQLPSDTTDQGAGTTSDATLQKQLADLRARDAAEAAARDAAYNAAANTEDQGTIDAKEAARRARLGLTQANAMAAANIAAAVPKVATTEGAGATPDVIDKALALTGPTGDSSIYSYTPPKEEPNIVNKALDLTGQMGRVPTAGFTDANANIDAQIQKLIPDPTLAGLTGRNPEAGYGVTDTSGASVPLPIARPADLGITDTSGNPIVPKATGGDSATVDVVKKAASDTGTSPDDIYRDLMNQPGWGSEDPGLIADFNKYAFEKYGLKLGPTTKSGEISVGQTTPQVMVPRVNPDGSVTMVPTLGSVINTGLEELMNPLVKIGTKAYADLGGSNVGALKTTDTTGGTSGGTTDTTIKGSKDTVQPTGSGDTSGKTTPSTPFVPIVLGSTGKPLIPVEPGAYESYGAKGYGASTYQNPYLTRFLATGGSVHGNNAIANSLRFVKGNKA
jgi:hypothetical protein